MKFLISELNGLKHIQIMFRELNKIKEAKDSGLKVGFTCSTFDLLHAGHSLMLKECRDNCDFLIVGILSDPTISRPESKLPPYETLFERWLRLDSLHVADMIIPFSHEEDLENMMKILKPDIRFVGEEYKGKEFGGSNVAIPLFYNSRQHNFSSSKIKGKL